MFFDSRMPYFLLLFCPHVILSSVFSVDRSLFDNIPVHRLILSFIFLQVVSIFDSFPFFMYGLMLI